MVLDRTGKLVRWTYLFSQDLPRYDPETDVFLCYSKAPERTTLCRFFWRCFVFMPLGVLILGSTALAILGGLLVVLWEHLIETAIIGGIVLGGAALFLLMSLLYDLYKDHLDAAANKTADTIRDRVQNSTFMQGVKAVKGKVCPIITFQ